MKSGGGYLFGLFMCFIGVGALAAIPEKAMLPQKAFAKQFQTTRVYFPDEDSPFAAKNPGRNSWAYRMVIENILAWSPTGQGQEMSAKCQPDVWGRRLRDPRVVTQPHLQGALVQKYLKDCGDEIKTGKNSSFTNMLKMTSLKFSPQENPFLHRVVFSLPGNIKLKGLLALKGDFKKRPLVVLRSGVFSNVEEFLPERAWMMMLFDQSPFNVLLVENMTSTDFVADNTRFAFGGYDEGLQNILIAQILKDPNEPLSRLVESLHLFGASLGGHGVFFASLLNEFNSQKGRPLYQSFVGMCPVVDLNASMLALTTDKPMSLFSDLWARKRLAGLDKKMPSVDDHESFGFLKKAVSEVARTYKGGLSYVSSVKLPPGMEDGPHFWQLNDFWKYYKNVQQPVLVFATHTDPLVPFAVNAERLQNKQLKIDSENITAVDFAEGVHCTLPIPYDWKAITTLIQSYVLSHSPGFQLKEQSLEMPLADAKEKDFYKGALKLSYKVLRPENNDKFVGFKIEMKNDKDQSETLQMNLPLSQFDFRFLDAELSPSEQWMIERWVNQNVSLSLEPHAAGEPVLKMKWFTAQ